MASRMNNAGIPEGGYLGALVRSEDPAESLRWLDRWHELEESMDSLRRAHKKAREEQAVGAGAPGIYRFLAAGHSVPPDDVLREFTRGGVEVLDEMVAEAARERWARFGVQAVGSREEMAAVAALSSLGDHKGRFPAGRLAPLLRRLGDHLGLELELSSSAPGQGRVPLWTELRGNSLLILGSLPGPGGLVRALAGFGGGARATFLSGLGGPEDPEGWDGAFAEAAEVLFRRLALSSRFGSWCGLELEERGWKDLRFEEAVGHRRAWAYLLLAARGEAGPSEATAAIFRRATGRPATPDQVGRTWDLDPRGAEVLRGTVLGLLLEERLMTRFGKLWFLDRGAGRFLKELWESEPGETAESMAEALALGRIEPTPIVDLYRL